MARQQIAGKGNGRVPVHDPDRWRAVCVDKPTDDTGWLQLTERYKGMARQSLYDSADGVVAGGCSFQ